MTKSKINRNEVAERVERQAVKIVVDHPFWSSLLLQMGVQQVDHIPTACTDGDNGVFATCFCSSTRSSDEAPDSVYNPIKPASATNAPAVRYNVILKAA